MFNVRLSGLSATMKTRIFLSLLACFALLATAPCQITTPKGSQSDLTNLKLAQLDLVIKLVPLAIQKSQFEDLLTGVEKAREIYREALKKEDAVLAQLDPTVTSLIDNATQKGVYPSPDNQKQIDSQLIGMRSQRLLTHALMVSVVLDAIKAHLNDGQIKAMEGSFPDSFIQPGAKPGEITPAEKLRFFVGQVFCDPLCYDLLVEMSKHAS